MTNNEFKLQVREKRGSLKSMDSELECINTIGTSALIAYTIHTKNVGISIISEISRATAIKQNNFIVWVQTKRRNKQDIDLYMSAHNL
jgi:hypothetical protein